MIDGPHPSCECEHGPTKWGRGENIADTCAVCGGMVPAVVPADHHDSAGPDDPIGTVRATDGILAIRANSANPDYPELSWFIIDVGVDDLPANTEDLIATWPIVYQPGHVERAVATAASQRDWDGSAT